MYQECRHIKTNGQRCHAPALRGKPYCWFHMNLKRMHSPKLAESQRFQLPPIEDTASVLLGINQVLRHLSSPYADTKRAGQMLYALQLAARVIASIEDLRPREYVRVLYSPENDEVDFSAALDNGTEMLAPDKTICEPPKDCRTCPKQNTCKNYEEPEEEEYEDEENAPDPDEQDEDEEEGDDEEQQDEEEENEIITRALTILTPTSKHCHSDRPSGVEEPAVAFSDLSIRQKPTSVIPNPQCTRSSINLK